MAFYHYTTKKKALKGTSTDDWFFGSAFKDVFDGRSGDDHARGEDGNDSLSGGLGNDSLYGGKGSDRLFGLDGHDVLDGGDGADRLNGGDGNDGLYGRDGNDSLTGDAGDDNLNGGIGQDRLKGGAGNDYLAGEDDNDRLDGGAGDDQLYGGAGADKLSGGDGDDNLDGGASTFYSSFRDTMRDVMLAGGGDDSVTIDAGDFAMGGKGIDTLNVAVYYTSADTKYNLDFSKVTGKRAVDFGLGGAKAGQFEKVDVTLYSVDTGSTVKGSKGSDTFYVSGKAAFVDAGAGNDHLSGSSYEFDSDDNPIGGITLNGGAGDDYLSGSGHVTLMGGAGTDQFSLSPNSTMTIADLAAKDVLVITSDAFHEYDYALQKYVTPVFDRTNLLVVGADPKASSALAQFLYDTDDGKLYYDADGTGLKHDAELVTTLSNKAALTASSFLFQL
ncbi:MAG: calcium-binding protein [Microvirga sp.]